MIKQVAVSDLKIGVYVSALDRPWLGTPFLFEGFTISSDEELHDLRTLCTTVHIDTSRGLDIASPVFDHSDTGSSIQKKPKKRLDEALVEAKSLRSAGSDFVNEAMHQSSQNNSIDIRGASETVKPLADNILDSPGCQLWLTQLKNRDEYTATHSLNVCVLALVFGKHLGYQREQLYQLGTAAILHDIGKMQVPMDILNLSLIHI